MPEMLPAAELAQLRTDVLELMPDTAVISRGSAGTAETHGYNSTVTYAAIGTASARLDPLSRGNQNNDVIASHEAAADFRQLTVPYSTDIARGDRVVIGGRTSDIRSLDDDHSLRAVRRAVLVVTK